MKAHKTITLRLDAAHYARLTETAQTAGLKIEPMLRQLISKWGIMSIEMQTAMDKDMAAINDDGSVDYVDNLGDDVTPQQEPDNTIDVDPSTGEVLPGPQGAASDAAESFFED